MEDDIKEALEEKFKISFRIKKVKNGIVYKIFFEDFTVTFYFIQNFTFNYNINYLINQINRIRQGIFFINGKEGIEDESK